MRDVKSARRAKIKSRWPHGGALSSLLVVALFAAPAGCAAEDDEPAGTVNTLLTDGDYFVGIKLSLAGAQLRMKISLTAEGEADKGGKLSTLDMYALGTSGDWISDAPIASVSNVEVKADGTFTADLGKVIVPAKASPTGSPVGASLTLEGTIDSANNTFCGGLQGDIPDFKADLAGSTFKAVPFGSEGDPYAVSCKTQAVVYDPIATCPTLKAGVNKMTSATFERQFVIVLPAAATATGSTAKLPVVFLYHGNTGNAAGILKSTTWDKIHGGETADPFILVAPETSAMVDGSKPVLDWRYGEKVFDKDNRELVFFSDMLKCIGEQHTINADRIYVTGMSGGGMMTTFLTAHRGKALAASAPLSGGYLHAWPKDASKVPMLVTWGGETDEAYNQNFHTLAKSLLKALGDNGWWHASCDHGKGHEIPLALMPHVWTFLKAHTRGASAAPFAAGLPKDFPAYCKL